MNKCPMFVLYIYSDFPVLTLQALSTAYGQAVWVTVEILPGTPVLCDFFFTLDTGFRCQLGSKQRTLLVVLFLGS